MKNNSRFSRRTLLQGAAVTAGALAYNGIPGSQLVNRAFGQTAGTKSALFIIFLDGGYNAVFPSADSFRTTGTFGITGDNSLKALANGLVVDAATLGTLPETALANMASVGIRHGISDHGTAKSNLMTDGTRAHYLKLAAAMGGSASIKAAVVGGGNPAGPRPAEGAVSLQSITDMKTTIDALGGGAVDPSVPDRVIAATGLEGAQAQSQAALSRSSLSLKSMREGYAASIDTIKKPVQAFNFNQMALPCTPNARASPATAVNNFTQQVIAAELMIRSGTNVVFASNGGWDSHGDRTAANVRNMMNTRILPPLKTFLTRINTDPTLAAMNITVAIMGDFSRSLPGSDHQNSLTATVIGKGVKAGTTGKVRVTGTNTNDARMVLDPAAASTAFWAYLAATLKVPGDMFGTNPHTAILV